MKIFNEMELYMKQTRNDDGIVVSSFQKDSLPSDQSTPREPGFSGNKELAWQPTNIGKVQHSPPKSHHIAPFGIISENMSELD